MISVLILFLFSNKISNPHTYCIAERILLDRFFAGNPQTKPSLIKVASAQQTAGLLSLKVYHVNPYMNIFNSIGLYTSAPRYTSGSDRFSHSKKMATHLG